MLYTYGYIFYVPINIIYTILIFVYGLKNKKDFPYYIFAFIFSIYINAAINLTFFPIITMSKNEWGSLGNYINLNFDFLTMGGKRQIVGNILLLIPLGLLLPFVCGLKKYKRWICIIVASIAMEFLQLVIIYFCHSVTVFFDIRDIALNLLGGFIGILLFEVVSRLIEKNDNFFTKNKIFEYILEICRGK